MKNLIKSIALLAIIISLGSCRSIPKGATAVTPFDATRYLGKWYEIARMDFKYEKNLENATAEYSMRDDGLLKVDNKGYSTVKNEWTESIGKAKFRGDNNVGALKVSFFGNFYTGYNVISLDDDYKYALVVGRNYKYMWILSRENTIPDNIKTKYLKMAQDLGFKTEKLHWTSHDMKGK